MQCINLISVDHEGERYHVPCMKCNFCLQNRRNDWSFRLMEQMKDSETGYFLTMTYDQKHVPIEWYNDGGEESPKGYTLDRKDLHNFHKALRTANARWTNNKWKMKYYSVGEYGTRYERPHYHSIVYNVAEEVICNLVNGAIWGKGNVYAGTVTADSCGYVAKYLIDKEEDLYNELTRVKPFSVMSKGLGIGYLNRNKNWHREPNEYDPEKWRMYIMQNGYKKRMPRYYKDKIFKADREWFEDVMKTSKELHSMEILRAIDEAYLEDLERLLNLGHENPEEYKREQLKYQYEQVRIKSKKQNKLV